MRTGISESAVNSVAMAVGFIFLSAAFRYHYHRPREASFGHVWPRMGSARLETTRHHQRGLPR